MINFIYKNIHLLFFGFLIAFSSGFGQTFFISLFSNDFRQTFNLTNTEFGSLYSIATVLSAITIIWAGKLIDTVSLKKYTLVIVLGLGMTCLMASIVFNIFFLFRLHFKYLSLDMLVSNSFKILKWKQNLKKN